jgi:hypothetical protein
MWAKASGGVSSVDTTESYNGGANHPDVTKGRVKYSNLTLERPFNASRDRAVIRFLEKNLAGAWETTINDQDLDANDMALGAPVVYTGCMPVSVTGPEYNAESSDAGRVVVEFKVRTKV